MYTHLATLLLGVCTSVFARCVCISVARCVYISVARCVFISVARCVYISVC